MHKKKKKKKRKHFKSIVYASLSSAWEKKSKRNPQEPATGGRPLPGERLTSHYSPGGFIYHLFFYLMPGRRDVQCHLSPVGSAIEPRIRAKGTFERTLLPRLPLPTRSYRLLHLWLPSPSMIRTAAREQAVDHTSWQRPLPSSPPPAAAVRAVEYYYLPSFRASSLG